MNNFNSVFEELSKLYEEPVKEVAAKDANKDDAKAETETEVVEACKKQELIEAADEEEVVDEVPVEDAAADAPVDEEEIEIVDDEPRQLVVECSKCGALVVMAEDKVVVDEETDLVNVEDECQFCEETAGYKIVGTMIPYEVVEAEEDIPEESVDEEIPADEAAEEEEELIDEDLADVYRKVFDKPASTNAQQSWEDELNGEMGEISDKRRAHLERKFKQQRDWEARHADELEELLDIKPSVSVSLDGGEGNDVDVL